MTAREFWKSFEQNIKLEKWYVLSISTPPLENECENNEEDENQNEGNNNSDNEQNNESEENLWMNI